MFDYKLIEAFAAVITEGGFEKAAGKLFITQSAVSQRVKQLEEQFGQIILLRSSPPQPTKFGRKLLGIYNKVDLLEGDLKRSNDDETHEQYIKLPIGINADTLATWFFAAIHSFLESSNVLVDLYVDDQEETHGFLRDGKVLGCITTRKAPIQGCFSHLLGGVEYGLYCSQTFKEKWFRKGINTDTIRDAPMITFNRKDRLNLQILKKILGYEPHDYPTHYVPSSEVFLDFLENGLAYGAIPGQQSDIAVKKGYIVDLAPHHHETINLYWQCWNLDSKILHRFTQAIVNGFAEVCLKTDE